MTVRALDKSAKQSTGLRNDRPPRSGLGRYGVPGLRRPGRYLAGIFLFVALAACTAVPSAAFAERGHVLSPTHIGEPGSGPGQLKEPSGVAVNEATGDVYVIDAGNDRVEYFSSAGTFEGEFKGPSTTGTGSLTAGQTTVTSVLAMSGQFSVGEEVSAVEGLEEGLEPGTTIEAVDSGARTLTLSKAATKTMGLAELKAHQSFNFSAGSPEEVERETSAIAIDNSCQLHQPEPLTEATTPKCSEYDPSTGDVYVGDPEQGVIDKFTAAGQYIGQAEGVRPLNGIATNNTGELWAYTANEVLNYPGATTNTLTGPEARHLEEPLATSLGFSAPGFAVDSSGDSYVHYNDGQAGGDVVVGYSRAGKLLVRAVDGEPPSGVAVELSSGDVYVDNVSSVGRFRPGGVLVERLPVPGGGATGVATDASGAVTEGSTLFVATSSGQIDLFTPQAAGAPTIEGESLPSVNAGEATVAGEVNPRGLTGEYHFEYGRCSSPDACAQTGFEAGTPVGSLPADFQVHDVTAHLSGLAPGATYHFRVSAHNAEGTAVGAGRVFSTPAVGDQVTLPDGRQWELVSPQHRHGSLYEPIGSDQLIQSAAGGGAFSYTSVTPTETELPGSEKHIQVLSIRTPNGWQSKDISLPQEGSGGQGTGFGQQYVFFNNDLSEAVAQPFGAFAPAGSPANLSPYASEQTAFLADLLGTENGLAEPGSPPASPTFSPLVTGCPKPGEPCPAGIQEHANVPPGTVFGISSEHASPCLPAPVCGPEFVSATPDAQEIILGSHVALTQTTPAAPGGLYEWRASQPPAKQLQLISILPNREPASDSPFPELGNGTSGAITTGYGEGMRGAVSSDGSRVFWGDEGKLYVRDVSRGETVQLDAAEARCGSCGSGGGRFQFASSDGSRVFFTDRQPLTSDSGAEPAAERADLYECRLVVREGKLVCDLLDLTPMEHGEGAGVQGSILGASEDGTWVYFVANGRQGENPASRQGGCRNVGGINEAAPDAVCNLYVLHDGGGGWAPAVLVGVVSAEDVADWAEAVQEQPTRVSDNGLWLSFMSQEPLTGYDNRDVVSGRRDEEVFVYDAATGGLACASCQPSGVRPAGVEYAKINDQVAGGANVWLNKATMIAGSVPGWTPYHENPETSVYQSRYLSESGRLFFDSSGGLVPNDVNGQEDVYEWEPASTPSGGEGEGSCGSASGSGSIVFKPGEAFDTNGLEGREPAGCVGLISSGTSDEESGFLDASENGDDVFFLTGSQLGAKTGEAGLNVYDAHVCTSEAPCFPSEGAVTPPCNTEASCKASPTPQPSIFGAPASATFSGPGNPTPPAVSSAPKPNPCASSLGAPSAKCTKKQNLSKALATCKRKYPHSKKHRQSCEAAARKKYAPKKTSAKHAKPGK